jgi:hypothetical protein
MSNEKASPIFTLLFWIALGLGLVIAFAGIFAGGYAG